MKGTEAEKTFDHAMMIRVNILRQAAIDFKYANYLQNEIDPIKLNDHWRHIKHNFLILVNLNLAKLFDENKKTQKFNFFTFLNHLESDNRLKHLGKTSDKIKYFRDKLTIYKPNFLGIKKIRNQWIAHTDYLGGFGPTESYWEITKKIIDLGFEIANEFSQTILEKGVANTYDLYNLNGLIISS
jgi:hypothetical protein